MSGSPDRPETRSVYLSKEELNGAMQRAVSHVSVIQALKVERGVPPLLNPCSILITFAGKGFQLRLIVFWGVEGGLRTP